MRKLLLILFTLLTEIVWAEGEVSPAVVCTIKGVVLDENGAPLPGASVWVKGSTIGAGTNTQGEFLLKLRSSGEQVLRFSFTGYKPQEFVWNGQEGESLVIRLEPAQNSLEEVVVTGTRTPKPLKEVPVLTQVISQDAIQQINPLDFQTLLEFALPGLQFGQAHGSNLPELSFQGAAGGYVLFLVDGERMAGEGASNNIDYERIDVDNIERIEVIKGPMSTLYGSQAMGGVVNIITKDADRPFTADLTARLGNKDEMKYSASLGTKLSRFSSYTTFSYRRRDAYKIEDREGAVTEIHKPDTVILDTADKSSTTVLGYDIWQIGQKLGYALTDNLKAEISGNYYHNKLQDPFAGKKEQEVYSTFTLNPRLSYTLGKKHLLTLSWWFDDYVKKREYTTGISADKEFEDASHTIRLHYSGEMGEKHILTAGLEVNTQRLQHYWFDDGSGAKFDQQNYVLYLQEDWKMTERFNVVLGLRSDCHSEYGMHTSPKVSLMYRLGDFTLRGGYGMGFRIPTLKELHAEYNMGGLGVFMIYGNSDLKPEISHQGTFSVEYTKGVFNGSVSGYYTKYKNAIGLGLTEDGENQQYYNAEDSKKSGVDVMGQVRLESGLTFNGAYSYVNCHEKTDGYNTSVFRPHSLTFTTNYSHKIGKVRISAAVNGRWLSKVDVWNKNSEGNYVLNAYASYTSVDLNLGARFPRGIRFTLGLDNVLNIQSKNVSADSAVLPQRGIEVIGTLGIHLADLFKW